MSDRWYLYVITNQVNGKKYIGITTAPAKRQKEHFSGYGSKLLKQAIAKYGPEKFRFDVLGSGTEPFIKRMEQRAIVAFWSLSPRGYNLTAGGDGSFGLKHSHRTRQRMSDAHSGTRNAMYGRRHSGATKRKIAARMRGKPVHPNALVALKGELGR